MSRYPSTTPRIAIGLAAIALTAITMTTAVIGPASFETAHATGIDTATIANARPAAPRQVVEAQCAPQG